MRTPHNGVSGNVAHMLMRGPRGRRMLMQFALASQRAAPERADSFGAAVFYAAHQLDPGAGTSRVLFGSGTGFGEIPTVTPQEVASRLGRVELVPVTRSLLVQCIADSVDSARYWQEPDGEDILMAKPELQPALARIAQHIASSPEAAWWLTPVDLTGQWAIVWDGAAATAISADPLAVLREHRDRTIKAERVAAAERPADPRANFSGEWWSTPPRSMVSTTRHIPDVGPAGLVWVEDGLGWERAQSKRVAIAPGRTVFEIDTAEAWAELCRQFPLDQTAAKRHDWYRATGRVGRWVTPNWVHVAERYAGVHLQVAAYLAAAGTAIAIDDTTSSVIAGWDPDQTYWFSPDLAYKPDAVAWHLTAPDNQWRADPIPY